MTSQPPSYRGYRFPSEIISHAVWLYYRFGLSFRDVEDLLAERGITVTYEAIRLWCRRTFGLNYARRLRRRRGRQGDTWYLDELFVKIQGQQQYLWRAVDEDGDVLDILVQSRRNRRAATRFFRKLLKPAWQFTPRLCLLPLHPALSSAIGGAGLYPDKYYSRSKTTAGWLPVRGESPALDRDERGCIARRIQTGFHHGLLPRLQQRTYRCQPIVEHLVLVQFAADPLCSHSSCLVECDLLADSNLRGRTREQEHPPVAIRVLAGLGAGQPSEARLEA